MVVQLDPSIQQSFRVLHRLRVTESMHENYFQRAFEHAVGRSTNAALTRKDRTSPAYDSAIYYEVLSQYHC